MSSRTHVPEPRALYEGNSDRYDDPSRERVIDALEDFGARVHQARRELREQLQKYGIDRIDSLEAQAVDLGGLAYAEADRLKKERYPTAMELRRGLATRQRVFAKTGTEQG